MKYSIKFTLSFIFVSILSFAAQAQNADWVRVQSDNGEFSIEMPKNPTYFFDKDGFSYSTLSFENSNLNYADVQMLNAADGKTVMSIEIYKVASPQKGIDVLLKIQSSKASKIKDLPKDFAGKQIEKSTIESNQKNIEISFVSKLIASKTHIYIVTVANRGAKTAAFERFLSSMKLGVNQPEAAKIATFKALLIEDIGFDAVSQAKPPITQSNQNVPPDKSQDSASILILTKPFAGYTDAARNNLTSGVIRLRVTFEKTGRISKIGIISGLVNGLNRSAFFAALRIKFIPLETDGVPVTVTKPVEYSFNVQ